MTSILTRAAKGSPLLNSEIDSNFTNLNEGKVELDGSTPITGLQEFTQGLFSGGPLSLKGGQTLKVQSTGVDGALGTLYTSLSSTPLASTINWVDGSDNRGSLISSFGVGKTSSLTLTLKNLNNISFQYLLSAGNLTIPGSLIANTATFNSNVYGPNQLALPPASSQFITKAFADANYIDQESLYVNINADGAYPAADGQDAIAIGENVVAQGANAVGLGKGIASVSASAIAIGEGASAAGNYAAAMGRYANAGSLSSLAIGHAAVAPTSGLQLRVNHLGLAGATTFTALNMSLSGEVSITGDNAVSASYLLPAYADGAEPAVTGNALIWDSTNNAPKVYNGATWDTLGGGGGGGISDFFGKGIGSQIGTINLVKADMGGIIAVESGVVNLPDIASASGDYPAGVCVGVQARVATTGITVNRTGTGTIYFHDVDGGGSAASRVIPPGSLRYFIVTDAAQGHWSEIKVSSDVFLGLKGYTEGGEAAAFATERSLIYNNTSKKPRYHDGSSWKDLATEDDVGGGGGETPYFELTSNTSLDAATYANAIIGVGEGAGDITITLWAPLLAHSGNRVTIYNDGVDEVYVDVTGGASIKRFSGSTTANFHIKAGSATTFIVQGDGSYEWHVLSTDASNFLEHSSSPIEIGNDVNVTGQVTSIAKLREVATTTYTTVADDQDRVVSYTGASAGTFTIDDSAHPVGTTVCFEQSGAGSLTIALNSGTLTPPPNATAVMLGAGAMGGAYKRAAGNWTLFGNFKPNTTSYNLMPVGAILPFPSIVAPDGWLKLDGATYNRADYPALWAFAQASGNLVAQGSKALGNFGDGDGFWTFSVPDYRAEVIRGLDDGRGVDTGRTIGSWQAGSVGDHQHYVLHSTDGTPPNPQTSPVSSTNTAVTESSTGGEANAHIAGDAGAADVGLTAMVDAGGEFMSRNVAALYCIKV